MNTHSHLLAAVLAGTILAAGTAFSPAIADENYPERVVTIVVPVSPGGLADIIARTAAERLSSRSGQTFVVDYIVGAGGSVGTQAVVRSDPDGYTLGLVTESLLLVNPHLFRNLSYSVDDIEPVGIVATAPLLLLVPVDSPVETLEDFINLARDNPGALTYGSSGPGTMPHLVMHLFSQAAGLELLHIPYSGGGASVTDLTAGRLDILAAGAALVAGSLGEGGALRAIAVSGPERLEGFPDVPTVAESGVPDFAVEAWWGLAAPKGTPSSVITSLNAWLSIEDSSEVELERLTASHLSPTFLTADEMAEILRSEEPTWERIVREIGITLD